MRAVVVGVLLLWWTGATARYIPVWNTPIAFAAHVAHAAPMKPRPLILYGALLASQGRLADARLTFQRAAALATRSQVPVYDRRQALEITRANLQALDDWNARLRSRGWIADTLR